MPRQPEQTDGEKDTEPLIESLRDPNKRLDAQAILEDLRVIFSRIRVHTSREHDERRKATTISERRHQTRQKKDSQIRSGEGKKAIRPKNEKHSKVGEIPLRKVFLRERGLQ